MTHNGNRTEWSPIRPGNHTSDNKIGRPRSGNPICLSPLQTELDVTKVLLPINHKNYNFREKKSQGMKERENSH